MRKLSENGNTIEKYNEIPQYIDGNYFMNLPGVYCKRCGETFALYSFSAIQPHGIDENGKPFYNSCFKCNNGNA